MKNSSLVTRHLSLAREAARCLTILIAATLGALLFFLVLLLVVVLDSVRSAFRPHLSALL